ncbi:MAG: AEC family transporter [Xanthobacteraceae bacterium]|nr:AEC family transporter [Xanthobacteraceae bacterium]MCW5677883.1 AEC family transporter [Xanthobacteraceae bacterium]
MSQLARIAEIVLPVFGVIGLGYFSVWSKLLTEKAGEGLNDFVFVIAIPIMIVKTLLAAQLPEGSPWGYWLSYFIGVAVVWSFTQLVVWKIYGRPGREAVIMGFSSAQSNIVLMGIPLVLTAYGEAGAVPLFLLIAVHLPIMMLAATVMIESAEAGVTREAIFKLVKNLVTNPLLIAFAVGSLGRIAGVQLGGAPKQFVDMIALAAVPCALFAMGMALRKYGVFGDLKLSLFIVAAKLMLLPLAVYLLAKYVFALSPVWHGVAVIFASMAVGINSYLLAARYKTGVATVAGAVTLSTMFSLLTVSFWLFVLGIG